MKHTKITKYSLKTWIAVILTLALILGLTGQVLAATTDTFTITVTLDIAAPTQPGTPSTTSPTTDTTPTWTWTASTDGGSGLRSSNTYKIYWDTTEGGTSNSAFSDTNSYTHTVALALDTWYVKVEAYDNLDQVSTVSGNGSVVIQAPDTTDPTATGFTLKGNSTGDTTYVNNTQDKNMVKATITLSDDQSSELYLQFSEDQTNWGVYDGTADGGGSNDTATDWTYSLTVTEITSTPTAKDINTSGTNGIWKLSSDGTKTLYCRIKDQGGNVTTTTDTIGGYLYKKSITFDTTASGANVSTAQDNFPVCVHINSSSWSTQAERDAFFDTNTGGKRIRFYDSNESTELSYEVEYFDNTQGSEEAVYWVKVPQVAGNSNTDKIVVAYGNDPYGSDQDNPTGVWDNNYVGVLHMNDTNPSNGTAATDSSSYGNNGSYKNTESTDDVPGQIGYAIDFDGSNEWIDIDAVASDLNPFVNNQGTISVWINRDFPNTQSVYRDITNFSVGTNVINLYYHKLQDQWAFNYKPNGVPKNARSANTYGAQNNWAHATFVWQDGGIDSAYTYWDGGYVSTSGTGVVPWSQALSEGSIAARADGACCFFDGTIDEVRYSKVRRLGDWIKLEYYTMKKTSWNGDEWITYGTQQGDYITDSISLDGTVPTQPGAPSTTSPTTDTTPTWIWTASTDGGSGLRSSNTYKIYWDTTAGGTTNSAFSDTNSYTHTVALAEGTWYVKVEAYDNADNTSTVSGNGSVVVTSEPCTTPGTPSSPSPDDGATGISIDADLDWADCSDADSYDVYGGTSPTPGYLGNTASSSYTLPTHAYETQYYWKIVAKNGCGTTEGPVWDFTTEPCPTPGTPSGPSPGIGATGVSVSAILDWTDCSGTDTYEVYLDTNPTPTTKVGESSISSYDPDLNWDTHYYWKIIAKNDCGNSTEGPVWDFTAGPDPGADHFVWDASPSPGAPYDSWNNAAHTIQAAINYASAGETVMVRAGTSYTEHVFMHDGKDLVAEEGAKPSITWSPGFFVAVVEFTGPMTCNLKGFDIRAGTNMGEGVTLDGTGGQVNATIEDCIVHCDNLGVGIRMLGTVNTTIKDCVVYNSNVSMRAGIGTSGWGSSDRIASGSSITIKGTTVGGSGQGVTKAGIRLRGATGASNIRATIGGSGVSDGNTISYNGAVGIILVDIDEVSIENNDISNNGDGGIVLVDSNTVIPHIKNNTIHHQTSAAGINIGGASNVTIGDNNNIYANNTGIAFYVAKNEASFGDMDPITKTKSSQPVTITGNNIYSNSDAGIAVKDGISGAVTITQNNIYSNTRAGIRMQRSCTLDINRNDIHDNLRGGIHTGSDVADGGGFIAGHIGLGLLTIEKNKIYDNGQGGYGAGIDVRHMPGTIYNNLIYGNHRGGIRFGDYITEIVNNTVADNGNDNGTQGDPSDDTGGGIIYDDLAGAVNDAPAGVPALPLLIRNNISAYNVKAGVRACFDNTEGSEERDYNLLYANRPWNDTFNRANTPDCGWPTLDDMSCIKQQYGGCVAYFVGGVGILLDDPNDIVAGPLFKDMAGNDYRLQRVSEDDGSDSPAINAGDDNLDMGCYGGSEPLDW